LNLQRAPKDLPPVEPSFSIQRYLQDPDWESFFINELSDLPLYPIGSSNKGRMENSNASAPGTFNEGLIGNSSTSGAIGSSSIDNKDKNSTGDGAPLSPPRSKVARSMSCQPILYSHEGAL
jgi:hypothetical protein